ncbi:MAG: LptF/LptG family permease [Gemmataceae bacterium]|nr:LptF/LptG family permease [Gemmataceae bacterium]
MPGWKLIHRMILAELVKVFLLAWTALTSLLLLAGLIAEATQHGLGPGQILGAIPLLLPNMLPYTLPTTTLFATCIVYGRLAADNEILAIKSAGVHIGQVVVPALFLGLAASIVTMALYLNIIPVTHFALRGQVLANVQDYLYAVLRKEGRLQHPKINYTIYVKSVDGDILRDAHFMRRDPKTNQIDVVARAKEAKLRVERAEKVIWVHMFDCWISNENGIDVGYVEHKAWPVELPPDLESQEKFRATDMTWLELFDFRRRYVEARDKAKLEIAAIQAKENLGSLPNPFNEHMRNLRYVMRHHDLLIAAIDAEFHMRPALALGCLCFVLVGCPVGIWFSRSDYLSAFITCFVPIIVLYYPLLLSGINLAKLRQVPPVYGIWAANALMLIIALALFRRLARN